MLTVLSLIKGPPNSKGRHDDFSSDRLNHRYTVGLLASMSFIVTANHFVGEKIQCLVPAHFSGSWRGFVDSYCWVKNTYYLSYDEEIQGDHENRATLAYYQWVPLILQLQALLYFLPCLLWRTLSTRSGIDLDNFLKVTGKINMTDDLKEKKKLLKHSVILTDRFLTRRTAKNTSFNMSLTYFVNKLFPRLGRSRGNYLTILYTFIKFLYVTVAISQFALLNKMLGVNFHTYGIDALVLALQGEHISSSNKFPRATLCDVKVRNDDTFITEKLKIKSDHDYTVQCVLPINLFHEMVFLLLWFWMFMLVMVSLYSLIIWIGRLFLQFDKHNFVAHYMRYFASNHPDSSLNAKFTQHYLRHDGVFLLRLLQENFDQVMTHDICKALWERYSAPH